MARICSWALVSSVAQTVFELGHHLGLGPVPPALEDQLVILDGLAVAEAQRLPQEVQDGGHGLIGAPLPVPLEGVDGLLQPLLPALIDALEGIEQLDALGIGRAVGIELAHRVESLAQGILPLVQVAGLLGQVVEDRHARARGEAHQLDLDAVLFLDALGAVHHQDDAGPGRDRLQQGAVVGEERIVRGGLDRRPAARSDWPPWAWNHSRIALGF